MNLARCAEQTGPTMAAGAADCPSPDAVRPRPATLGPGPAFAVRAADATPN